MKIMEKIKNKERSFPMHCLFRSNVDDIKIMPLMSYITNTMHIFGYKIFNGKLKINSISIRTGNVEYIMTQKDHKCRIKSVIFTCWPHLKLYCRYLYTRPCMINHIWGLKQLWLQVNGHALISFATAPLTCSERGGSEKFKMKIYASSGIRTHTPPVHDRNVVAP